jgi:hypothetical protein
MPASPEVVTTATEDAALLRALTNKSRIGFSYY